MAQCYKESENAQHTVNYFHCDQIGIPREMTDSQGKLIWKGRYDAWGQLIHDSNRHAQRTTHQPFRLQNQYFDQETGLHYNFLRYYEPTLGRFITQDPIGLMGGMNLYSLARNAISYVDPLGLSPNNNVDQFGDYYGSSARVAKIPTCQYSITLQTFVCKSKNPNTPNLIKSIDPSCIHSGRNEHKNNPDSVNVQDYGPIWPGVFTMKPNTIPGHDGWYALQPVGWSKIDSILHYLGVKRAGANLHIGTVSHGCITVSSSCQEQFDDIINFLNAESVAGYENILEVVK